MSKQFDGYWGLWLYKWKTYLSSVSRHIQNRRLDKKQIHIPNRCADCSWYYENIETCQVKKCSTDHPEVNIFDRMWCEYFRPKEKNNE